MQWIADQMNGELYELLRWSNICTSSFPLSYHLFCWRNLEIFYALFYTVMIFFHAVPFLGHLPVCIWNSIVH